MNKEKNKCYSKGDCKYKDKGGNCIHKDGVGCEGFHPPKKIKKYTPEEAQAIIQESVVKANKEIGKILKQHGLTLRVVHSVEIVPNVEYNEINRKTNV